MNRGLVMVCKSYFVNDKSCITPTKPQVLHYTSIVFLCMEGTDLNKTFEEGDAIGQVVCILEKNSYNTQCYPIMGPLMFILR